MSKSLVTKGFPQSSPTPQERLAGKMSSQDYRMSSTEGRGFLAESKLLSSRIQTGSHYSKVAILGFGYE